MHFTKHKSSSRMKNRNEDNIVRFRSNISQMNKEMLPQYNALKNLTIQSCSHFNYVFLSIKMTFFNVSFISIPGFVFYFVVLLVFVSLHRECKACEDARGLWVTRALRSVS